jgi:hypothetical protein
MKLMNIKVALMYAVVALMLVAIVPAAAFPLQTDDGKVTIFGMVPTQTQDGFALDIFSPYDKAEGDNLRVAGYYSQSFAQSLKINIVDSDDRFIKSSGEGAVSNSKDRALYLFSFDEPVTQIKRIRIETPYGDVYSIPWSGVPEVSTDNISMRLYGISSQSRDDIQGMTHDRYNLEVRIANNLSSGLTLSPKYFMIEDQFGYGYEVEAEEYKLMPGEAIRYNLSTRELSPLSRPKALCFVPENITIDIEGWY